MIGSGIAARAAVLAVALGATVGCGDGTKGSGTVSGTVAYKGAPVTGGEVNFLGKNGAAAVGKIDGTGAFKIDGQLEAGDYKVYFSAAPPEPAAPGTKAAPKPKADLPPKHKDPALSTATATVKPGTNVVPVEFKD